jgi:integration host factor subunit alpha
LQVSIGIEQWTESERVSIALRIPLWEVALAVLLLNLPFGFWRDRTKRFTLPWYLVVHLPVPVVVGLSKHESRILVESLFEFIKKLLESGEDVLISGFGKFIVKEKVARRGRNPATGEDLTLDSRRVITFKCSARMRARIKGGG